MRYKHGVVRKIEIGLELSIAHGMQALSKLFVLVAEQRELVPLFKDKHVCFLQ